MGKFRFSQREKARGVHYLNVNQYEKEYSTEYIDILDLDKLEYYNISLRRKMGDCKLL